MPNTRYEIERRGEKGCDTDGFPPIFLSTLIGLFRKNANNKDKCLKGIASFFTNNKAPKANTTTPRAQWGQRKTTGAKKTADYRQHKACFISPLVLRSEFSNNVENELSETLEVA